MNGDVEPEELDEGRILSVAEECSQIPGVILAGVDSRDLALAVDVAEDAASNIRELGNPAQE